jgi:hypothetical protein
MKPIKLLLPSWLLLVIALAIAQLGYWRPLPAYVQDNLFSAERARATLNNLTKFSRFPDTQPHSLANNMLSNQLRSMGYDPQVQNFTIPDTSLKGTNLIARLPGTKGTRAALLLEAHYDTNPNMVGAADNASGVAIVLEIARALKSGPALQNDVIILLSDAEELGVFGSAAFVAEHAWAKDVRLVLNFDTFSSGAAFIWNTSPDNGWLVNAYQQVAPAPLGVAWVDQLARMLPMDTDLSPFLRAGISGVNFTTPFLPFEAHTANDKPEIIEPGSLQHAGEQGLAFARYLADQDLTATRAADVLYFNLAGSWMVSYGAPLAAGLGGLALIVAVFVILLTCRREAVSGWGTIKSGLFNLLLFLALPLVELALWMGVYLLAPTFPQNVLILGSALLVAGLYLLAYLRLRKGTLVSERLVLGLGLWGLLTVLSSWFNFFLSQPTTLIFLFGAGAAACFYYRARLGAWAPLLGSLSLSGAVFFFVPLVYLLLRIAGQVIIPAVVAAAVLVLGLMLILPLFELLVVGDGAVEENKKGRQVAQRHRR